MGISSVLAMNIWPGSAASFWFRKIRHVTVDHEFHITRPVRNYGIYLRCRVIQKLEAFLYQFLSRCRLLKRKSAEWG